MSLLDKARTAGAAARPAPTPAPAPAPATPAGPPTAMSRAGLFKGMGSASFRSGGNYMDPNHTYDLEILCFRTFNDRAGKKDIFVADFLVIGTTSTNPATAPGSTVNYYTDDGFDRNVWLGNIKALFTTTYSSIQGEAVSPEDVGEEEAEALMGVPTDKDGNAIPGALPGTAARGIRIRCQTRGTKTKGKQQDFTVHNWFPVYNQG